MTSQTRIALLDVNVLVAMLDQEHPHFRAAQDWFLGNRERGWATCPITEIGLIRVLSSRRYSENAVTPEHARGLLLHLCGIGRHEFWPDSIAFRDNGADFTAVTSRQTTDLYLLALTVANGGRFVTLDRRIPARVLGDPGVAAIEVITP